MLARRFTLVCLAVTLFAMGLAMLAARDGRLKGWVELQAFFDPAPPRWIPQR